MIKKWEELCFEHEGLDKLEMQARFAGKHTVFYTNWYGQIVPYLNEWFARDPHAYITAYQHLLDIYDHPDEWVRADKSDALLTRKDQGSR